MAIIYNHQYKLLLALFLLLNISACKNREVEIFGQNGTIYGTIRFENLLKNDLIIDTVSREVIVRVIKGEDQDSLVYETTFMANDGKYNISYIREGDVKVNFTTTYPTNDGGQIIYSTTLEVHIKEDSRMELNPVLKAQKDNQRLVLVVEENTNAQVVKNVAVCLYTDLSFVNFDSLVCVGITSDTTNKWGRVIFTNLDPTKIYYFRASGMFNGQIHNNKGLTLDTGGALSGISSPFTIPIQQSGAVQAPCLKLFAKDENGNFLKDVEVCLFVSRQVMESNANSCNGSLETKTTAADGSVTFSGLNLQKYFFRTRVELGNLILSNMGGIDESNGVVNPFCADNADIIILRTEVMAPEPCIQIRTIDENGNPLEDVEVCLFVNQQAYLSNANSCEGSFMRDTSDADGLVVFKELNDGQNYYFRASQAIGNLIVSNTNTTSSSQAMLNCPLITPVELKEEVSTSKPCLSIHVADTSGAAIPNAAVCLFISRAAYQANINTCNGAITMSSDLVGDVVFNNLNDQTYFIRASANIGLLELNNNMTRDSMVSTTDCTTPVEVVIQQ